MTPRDVSAVVRKVAALRSLCLRLPHVPPPAERAALRRFEILAGDPAAVTADDLEALAAGWRRWWHDGNARAIRLMAARIRPAVIERDRRLATLASAAGTIATPPATR